MESSDTRQAQILKKVRGLLAKADSTTFPEEAATFREKADDMMVTYALEIWMVEAGEESSRPAPVARDMDTSWYWKNKRGSDLWSLFYATASHCRCTVIYWKGYQTTPVVGLPADLDYMDLLFTQLMLELGKRIEPKPDGRKSSAMNAYNLRASGTRWPRTTQLIYGIGQVKLPKTATEEEGCDWDFLSEKTKQAMKNKLAQKVRNLRRKEGLEDYTEVHPEVFQRSFASGFTAEIGARLRALNRAHERPSDGDGSGMGLALLDIREVVKRAAAEMFPKPGPPKRKGRQSYAIGRELKHDQNAYHAGSTEAKSVQIGSAPGERLGSRGKLGS